MTGGLFAPAVLLASLLFLPRPAAAASAVKIAVVQASDGLENPGPQANFARLANAAREAARGKPDLILFPEYALSGWPYPSADAINALAEPVPGRGPRYGAFVALARALRVAIVGWLPERDGTRVYNTAFVIDEHGRFVGKYRKVHANLGEQTAWGWSQGESLTPITLGGVRYGISICADMWFPETTRVYELEGADVILHMSVSDDMGHILPTRAFDSRMPIVASIFRGGSQALDAEGKLIGKVATGGLDWAIFTVEPFRRPLAKKYGGLWDEKRGHQNLRNLAAYAPLLDPVRRPAWTEVFFDPDGNPETRATLERRFDGRWDARDPALLRTPLRRFSAPFTSPYRVDEQRPHQLVNQEGEHLFVLAKTAWLYFGARDPMVTIERARRLGANVIRVALEGDLYFRTAGIDLWPWGGTRKQPIFSRFNEDYWRRVEQRIELAGRHGLSLDIVLYTTSKLPDDAVPQQRAYWRQTLERLGRYANIVTWEIHNEHDRNPGLQREAGHFFRDNDPHRRPVITSKGTRDAPTWTEADWIDMAVTHTCTSSTAAHTLEDWYLPVARNGRARGKPSFNNETGREQRHDNDDGVHRRKQAWTWTMAGGFWTWHSWDGCEGIDDATYRAPGEVFMRPLADYLRSLPFWRLDPEWSAVRIDHPDLVDATLATAERELIVSYLAVERSGREVPSFDAKVRLRDGVYRVRFLEPATGRVLGESTLEAAGLGRPGALRIPAFVDDLVIELKRLAERPESEMANTQ